MEREDTKIKIDYSNEAEVMAYLNSQIPGVNPTAEDFFNGKLYAYKLAAERKRVQEEEERKNNRRTGLMQMWTKDQMAEVAFNTGKAIGISEGFKFEIDDDNRHVFELLCLYFTNNPKFEEYGIGDKKYSLNKGIWLQSPNRGTGKTVLLKSFFQNKRCCFGYKHTEELRVMFQKNGFEAIDRYIGLVAQPASPLNFYQTHAGFMYDELFAEDKVMHMGSPLSLSSYIISRLYDFSNNHKGDKWKFHVTSNFDGKDIGEQFGETYRSRMPDMFNLIKLEGKDRRKA